MAYIEDEAGEMIEDEAGSELEDEAGGAVASFHDFTACNFNTCMKAKLEYYSHITKKVFAK